MTRTWGHRTGALAAVVVLSALLLRGYFLRGSYFNQDDFVAMAWVREYGLTWDYLLIEYAGHVNPGQRLLYALVVEVAPMDWRFAAVVVLAMVGLSGALMWHLLVLIGGARPAMLPALVLYCWSPLTFMPDLWFGAAIALLPPFITAQVALILLVRSDRVSGRHRLYAHLGVLAVFVVGLAFHERSLLTAPLLVLVALVLPAARDATGPSRSLLRRTWGTFLRHVTLWVGLALVGGAFLALYAASGAGASGGVNPDVRENAKLALWYVFRSVLPGLVSGPWWPDTRGGAVLPPSWAVGLAVLATVLLLVVAARKGLGRALWGAVFLLVAYVLLDFVLLLLGRSGFGAVIALDPRYSADIVLPAALAVGIACAALPTTSPGSGRWRRALPTVLVLAYVAGATLTTVRLAPAGQHLEDREYVENIRAGVRQDPSVVLLDQQVPAEVVLGGFGRYAMLSSVMSVAPEQPRFDAPSEKLRAVGPTGQLQPVAISDPTVLRGDDGACGFAVAGKPVRAQLPEVLPGRHVVRLSYFTDSDADLRVRIAGDEQVLPVAPGVRSVDYVVEVPADDDPVELELAREGFLAGTVCVTQVAIGLEARP